jgi:hypothetical protein
MSLPSERAKRAIVRIMLLPLRLAAAVYWYAGGRFVHTSRAEEALLRQARRAAAHNARGKAAVEDRDG